MPFRVLSARIHRCACGTGNCGRSAFPRSQFPLPRIVIEALLDDLVPTPELMSQFVLAEELPIVRDEFEYPVDDHTVALDKKSRHRKSLHLLEVIEHLLLARDKHFHSPAQPLQILLHRRIFGVGLTDGFDELAFLDQGDELLDAFTAGHVDPIRRRSDCKIDGYVFTRPRKQTLSL